MGLAIKNPLNPNAGVVRRVVLNYAIKKTPTPCLWQAPASTQNPESRKENHAGHSSERAVEGQARADPRWVQSCSPRAEGPGQGKVKMGGRARSPGSDPAEQLNSCSAGSWGLCAGPWGVVRPPLGGCASVPGGLCVHLWGGLCVRF